ncbi:MAG: hybrid sensor histidine kinase/response regulator, partial [Lautropia sp.]
DSPWPSQANSSLDNADLQRYRKVRFLSYPSEFSDSVAEDLFLREFRIAGLRSVAYACLLGMVLYLAFGLLEFLGDAWTWKSVARRAITLALLGTIVAICLARPQQLLAAYIPLLGVCSAGAIVGIVSLTRLFRDDDVTVLVSPASLLALGVLYGFGRLPIRIALLIGSIGSAFSLFGVRLTNMHEPAIRTIIYLVVANALGVLLARSIEMRERQLFLQRRVAEAAQAESELRTRLVERASAEKTRLIAAVGHDLRQPMLSAVLNAEVLTNRLDAGDLVGVRRQARRVEESVKLLGETLEHVLTAARYDAGTEPVNIEDVPLGMLFARLSELFGPHAAAAGIELRLHMPTPGMVIQTDEQALMRVLMNLVSNAIKFTPVRAARQTGVVVRAFERDGLCRIHVADTGMGIAGSDLESIWEPFVQIGNDERDRRKGIGLGLYLVRQSLRRLPGHSVSLRSTPGKGTCVTVSLPGRCSDEAGLPAFGWDAIASDAPEDSVSFGDLVGMRVILVEDDHDAREAIETQLKEWKVDFASGSSAEEVLLSCAEPCVRFEGIIADYRLPGSMNGMETIRALRNALGYEPGALLITAESNAESLKAGLPPATDYLQKPFSANALGQCIRQFTVRGSRPAQMPQA